MRNGFWNHQEAEKLLSFVISALDGLLVKLFFFSFFFFKKRYKIWVFKLFRVTLAGLYSKFWWKYAPNAGGEMFLNPFHNEKRKDIRAPIWT